MSVRSRAGESSRGDALVLMGLKAALILADAKVDDDSLQLCAQTNILWLDVAMNHAMVMEIGDALQHLPKA